MYASHDSASLKSHYSDVRKRLGLGVKPVSVPFRNLRNPSKLYAICYDAPIGPQRIIYSEIHVLSEDERIRRSAVRQTRTAAQNVIADIAEQHGYSFSSVLDRSRDRRRVAVRAIIAHRLYGLGLSLPQVGRVMGGRDHTTILHMLRSHTPEGERVR